MVKHPLMDIFLWRTLPTLLEAGTAAMWRSRYVRLPRWQPSTFPPFLGETPTRSILSSSGWLQTVIDVNGIDQQYDLYIYIYVYTHICDFGYSWSVGLVWPWCPKRKYNLTRSHSCLEPWTGRWRGERAKGAAWTYPELIMQSWSSGQAFRPQNQKTGFWNIDLHSEGCMECLLFFHVGQASGIYIYIYTRIYLKTGYSASQVSSWFSFSSLRFGAEKTVLHFHTHMVEMGFFSRKLEVSKDICQLK